MSARNLIILFFLLSCAKSKDNPCPASEWESSNGQKISLACQNLKYIRPNPPCEIEGEIESVDDTDETRFAWKLPRTCTIDEPSTELAFLTRSDDHVELSVPSLGIHAIFYKTN